MTFECLFSSHKSSHHSTHYFCDLCLNGFQKKDLLENHQKYCSKLKPQVAYTPKEGEEKSYMHFKNVNRQLELPFVIYADMECFIKSLGHHVPTSYAYKVVSHHPKYKNKGIRLFRGDNPIQHFLSSLIEDKEEIIELIKNVKPMILNEYEEQQFHSTTICHICKNPFTEDDVKACDHCHLTGIFRAQTKMSRYVQ